MAGSEGRRSQDARKFVPGGAGPEPGYLHHPGFPGGPPGSPRCDRRTEPTSTLNEVDHPAHYGGDTTYEAIKVIKAWGLGFCLGNAVKYVSRAGKKPGVSARTDLEKAIWYLQEAVRDLPEE